MNPIIEFKVWDKYRLQMLKVGQKALLFFPFPVLKKVRIPDINTGAHLDILKDGERIRVGQINIVGKREMSLGIVTDNIWVRHLGPGYIEEFIKAIHEAYDIEEPIDRFSYVQIVEIQVKHLDTRFVALQETKT